MSENERPLVETIHREAVKNLRDQSLRQVDRPGVHHSELPEAKPGEALWEEWNSYRREIARLLADGQEGKHVLIKGAEIIGIYDSWDAAREAGLKAYLLEPFFVHPIRAEEPSLRVRGLNFRCPS